MCNENIKRIAQKELERVGVNPAYLEAMVDLVNQPDDMQRLSEEYYSLQMENEILKRRFKAKLREVFYLDLKVKDLESKLKNVPASIDSRIESEMINCLVDIVHVDPCEASFIDELKSVQNQASWCIAKYGYKGVLVNE